jgi:hypothetical protein
MGTNVDDVQRLAAQQFANIEVMKFMMIDLWCQFLQNQPDPAAGALEQRQRQLQSWQDAVDSVPDSYMRQVFLGQAEENWRQIFIRLKSAGVPIDRTDR